MRSFYKKILISAFLILGTFQVSEAKEIMAILSDNLQPVSTNYIIYPETSNLLSQEISNKININGRIKALPVCNSINNSKKRDINKEVLQFVKEYQYTYNLNYDILRQISSKLDAKYILLISSGIDIQSQFLKETFWNMIPIGGENSVNPTYRIVTQITLIDPANELILLEKSYDQSLKSKNFDLIVPTFSPSYSQLNKIKDFTAKLATEVTPIIERELVPELMPPEKTHFENVKYKTQKYLGIKPKPENTSESNLKLIQSPNLQLKNYVYDDL